MITSAADERIRDLSITDEELIVAFIDGRTLSVPLVWYPRLFHASSEQRSDWRLIGAGEGVHWSQIDEDLSAAGLLRGISAPGHRDPFRLERSDVQEGSATMQKPVTGTRSVKVKQPVHVIPREDGWAVVREGNETASSVHSTQREAAQKGRQTARHDKTEFFLHNRQGQIRERDSYRSDPYPPKG